MNLVTFQKNRLNVYIIALCAITFGIYFQSFSHELIMYDDDNFLNYFSQIYQKDSVSIFLSILSDRVVANWHPVTVASLYVDYAIYKSTGFVGIFHISNLLIHIFNIGLLYFVLKRLSLRGELIGIVCFLFAIHPINVETVAWMSERKGLLAAFFVFLSILAYLKFVEKKSNKYLSYSIIAFIFAVLSKAAVVSLPVLLILVDYHLSKISKEEGNKFFLKKSILNKIPYFTAAIVITIITIYMHHKSGALAGLDALGIIARLNNFLLSNAYYIWQIIYPDNFSIYYMIDTKVSSGYIAATLLLLIGMFIAALYYRSRYELVTFGVFWYFILLLPVSGLVQTGGHAHADRYMYLPAIGIYLILSFFILKILSGKKSVRIVLYVLLGLALILVSYLNVKKWQNTQMLFLHSIQTVGDTDAAHDVLARFYINYDIDKAMYHFEKSVSLNKYRFPIYDKMFSEFLAREEYSYALYILDKAKVVFVNDYRIYRGYGGLYIKKKEYKKALEYLLQAKKLNTDDVQTYWGLATAYESIGELSKARENYMNAISMDKNDKYRNYLEEQIKRIDSKKNKN